MRAVVIVAFLLAGTRAWASDHFAVALFRQGVVADGMRAAAAMPVAQAVQSTQIRLLLQAAGVGVMRPAVLQSQPGYSVGTARTGERTHLFSFTNVYILEAPDSVTRDALILALRMDPDVIVAEPLPGVALDSPLLPNDPHFQNGDQWNLHNAITGFDVEAPQAWEYVTGSTGVGIAILDTGIYYDHPDIARPSLLADEDGIGHGTQVAGIAAAVGNNGIGVAGLDWTTLLLGLDVAGDAAIGGSAADQNIYTDVEYARNSGMFVINTSWHLVSNGTPVYSPLVAAAFSNVYKSNLVSVASMGSNGSAQPVYPAAQQPGIIAVGAIDRDGRHWPNSNQGAHIDLAAPGVHVWTTTIFGTPPYVAATGTSMAAPHVSGAAALLLGMAPWLYNDDVEQLLRRSARDLVLPPASPGPDVYTGAGLLDIGQAVRLLRMPFRLVHGRELGGVDVGAGPRVQRTFFAVPGFEPGVYWVEPHEIRRHVTYPVSFEGTPSVWGRGVASFGYGDFDPSFGDGFCEPVPGTITSQGCELRTYVYKVFDPLGRVLGWAPTQNLNEVAFGYSVHGTPVPLSATIGGPVSLSCNQQGVWEAQVNGGYGNEAYQWYEQIGHSWTAVATGPTYTRVSPGVDFRLRVVVTSFGVNAQAERYVTYTGCPGPVVGGDSGGDDGMLGMRQRRAIGEVSLEAAFPSPVRSFLALRLRAPRAQLLTLSLVDVGGRLLQTHAKQLSAGRQDVAIDVSQLPAGLYLLRLAVGNHATVVRVPIVY